MAYRSPVRRRLSFEQLSDRINPSTLHVLPFDAVQPDVNHTVPVVVQLDGARVSERVPVRVEVAEVPHQRGAAGYASAWQDFVPLRYNTVLSGSRNGNRLVVPATILGDNQYEGTEVFRITVTPLVAQIGRNPRAVTSYVFIRDVAPPPPPIPHAPQVVAPENAAVLEGDVFNGTWSFTDPDGGPWYARVHFDDGSPDLVLNNISTQGSFNLAKRFDRPGTYHGTITVDDSGAQFGNATFTVTVLNVAPTVNAGPDVTVTEGAQPNSFPMSGTFTDGGHDSNYSAIFYVRRTDGSLVEDGGVQVDAGSGTLRYNAVQLPAGDYTVTLEVNDGKATGYGTTHIHVLPNPPTPPSGLVVNAGPDMTVTEGVWPNSFALHGTFSDTSKLTYEYAIFYVYRMDGSLVEDGGVFLDTVHKTLDYSVVQVHAGEYRVRLEVHNEVVAYDELLLHVLPNV